MRPIDDSGDYMSLDSFKKSVECDALTDDDGYGELATETEVSSVNILPSDLGTMKLPDWATHVVWYNK